MTRTPPHPPKVVNARPDPKKCALCSRHISGHHWMVVPHADGDGAGRLGFCGSSHLLVGHVLAGDLPHELQVTGADRPLSEK